MAVHRNRRSTDASHGVRHILGRFLARPVIGVFIVVPLLGAVLGMGNPSWLFTASGVAALYLAVDLFLSWLRRPASADLGSHLNLVAWAVGIGAVSAAAWAADAFQYHGEMVALIGLVAALAVGLGYTRSVAVLWTVAAGAAVALGASVSGRLVVEAAMAVTAIAVGTWFGAVVGVIVERVVPMRRDHAGAPVAAKGFSASRGAPPAPADVRGRPSI